MFAFLKNKADDMVNRYNGKTDLLEGVAAIAALVTYADGEVEDEEVEASIEVMKAHKVVGASFKGSQIEATYDTMLKRAKTVSGRLSLMRELGDVRDRGDKLLCEDIFAIGVDVAHADGELEAPEVAVLRKAATTLGVNAADFGI